LKSTVIHISEPQSGSRIIAKEIALCIRSFKKTKCKNPLACVIPAVPICDDKLILFRSEEAIFINKLEIINKRAKIQFDTFNTLINAFTDNLKMGQAEYMSTFQLMDKMNDLGHYIEDAERIRKIIFEIKTSINQKSISSQDVIDSKYGFGYRINHKKVTMIL
jgi:hypothetical protein